MENLTEEYSADLTGLNPRERIAAIRKIQDDILAGLPLNTLYIVLHIRNDPPGQNDFHWGLYFHDRVTGGVKYHVTNPSSEGRGWPADHARTAGVMRSNLLCALDLIATIPSDKVAQVDPIMRFHDEHLNSMPGLTCRVWVLTIVKKPVEQGLVRCNDLKALEAECFALGNHFLKTAAAAIQPRPIIKSRVCH
ncbi:uncharacterized protein BO95DRAFT_487576 [Aspergillus brunneoviolaceus CBS 621.78]|uniref:Uncharacterized protein n=1 Tax=Aspergillus brunneoviolaceus CBS 621.78 TaxID=1450534 RepID=A0ACD1GIY6_9EURO|nr:hypothetical protein BO95DRAFT_487576 [Aspergillus brunneoviolaceus CBS 621.78]RAH49304.1 hypothetical protein BO95DRAFT_487576 [Aspergillus brunneoviolaceus CBS 621.78]